MPKRRHPTILKSHLSQNLQLMHRLLKEKVVNPNLRKTYRLSLKKLKKRQLNHKTISSRKNQSQKYHVENTCY